MLPAGSSLNNRQVEVEPFVLILKYLRQPQSAAPDYPGYTAGRAAASAAACDRVHGPVLQWSSGMPPGGPQQRHQADGCGEGITQINEPTGRGDATAGLSQFQSPGLSATKAGELTGHSINARSAAPARGSRL